MTLKQLLDRKHIVFDVETFGLSGDAFALGAVLGEFVLSSDGTRVMWKELVSIAPTDVRVTRPWKFHDYGSKITPGHGNIAALNDTTVATEVQRADFDWLEANIPASVFDPKRLTGDLSIHEQFDAFARDYLVAGTEWWAECPVPCEATFARDLAQYLDAPWGTVKIPPMRDVASLADPLGVGDERLDDLLPAHDPLNDARWSAERLRAAVQRLVRVKEHLR